MAIKDIEADKLINSAAQKLGKMDEFKQPEWSLYVKTGTSRERPPTQDNWWYLRAASIMRKLYLNPGLGVNSLRKLYGGRKNRGHKPEHKRSGSGKIIRVLMKQMETAGFLDSKKDQKGRVIKRALNKKGISFLSESSK